MEQPLSKPLVSIIIPVYNGADYLEEAIKNALAQTYENIEVIVVNDGSNDNGATEKIALDFGDKIRCFSKENGGVSSALNMGIKNMRGEYFSWLSHDDLYSKNKIETQVSEILKYTGKNIIFSDFFSFKNSSTSLTPHKILHVAPPYFRWWITANPGSHVHGCTLLIPKKAFLEHGLFNEKLKTTQDHAMWFRMAGTYNFIHIPQETVYARIHSQQGSNALSALSRKEGDELLRSFIDKLTPEEIVYATKLSLKESYMNIAYACLQSGFTNAHLRAQEKAEKATTKFDKVRQMKAIIYQRLKSTVKFFIPEALIKKLNYMRVQYPNSNLKDKFTAIYKTNSFGGKDSRSGEGSNLLQTEVVRRNLPQLIKKYEIDSMLDAPCGDWFWMKNVDLGVRNYIGVDIVQDLIDANNEKYANSLASFQTKNLLDDPLPKVDMIFSRDCLVHLSQEDVFKVLANFKKSGATYLLTTTFTKRTMNNDLTEEHENTVFWSPLNLQIAPFNFPPPLELINEKCTEGDGNFSDKSLGLWRLEDIKLP